MQTDSCQPTNETSFKLFCSAEWHLARMPRYASPLYSYAMHLAKGSGRFSLSLGEMAVYFGVDIKCIRAAAHALEKVGLFKLLREEPGKAVSYRPIPHKEWSRNRPTSCIQKISMPWDSETVDSLVKRLHAASDGRLRLYSNFVVGMRRTGLSDDEIVGQWEVFYAADNPVGAQWRGIYGRFMKHLRDYSEEKTT
jgi:hypothetical protein